LIRRAIDGPIANAAGGETAAGDHLLIAWLGLGYVGCAVAGAGFGYWFALLTARAGRNVVLALRTALHEHLLRLDPRWHDRHPTGQLVTRITTDVENLEQLVSTGVLNSLFDLLKVAGITGVLFAIDTQLATYTALCLPIAILISVAFRNVARSAYGQVRHHLARQNAFVGELIGGVRTIRAYGREELVDRRFDELNMATRSAWQRTVTCYGLFFASVDVALRWIQGGLLLVGGLSVLAGSMTAGVLVQFWLYLQKTIRPIRDLGEHYNVLQAALASLERLVTILDEPEQPADSGQAPTTAPRGDGEVRFDGVRFGYDPDRPVLENIDLVVRARTTCAIVGATGAGKTTLLALVSRLFDPDRGAVLLDGVSLRELPLAEVRRRVAVVPQEPYLFGSGSILDNVRLFDPEVSRERVLAVLETLGAARQFVDREGGLDAAVGERGGSLSQGERQLVAFARALLTNPDVLLLDEATASVDSATESRLQDALERLLAHRTCMVVAHRLSTVRAADRIVVVDRGRIVEQGSHAELVTRGGRYARMLGAASG
jgi:ATP-binding cassette subfamily B protein